MTELKQLSTIEELLVELVKGNTSTNEKLIERIASLEKKVAESCQAQSKCASDVKEVKLRVDDVWNSLKGILTKVLLIAGSVSAISFILGYFLRG